MKGGTYNLKQRQVAKSNIIKVHLQVFPPHILRNIHQCKTFRAILNMTYGKTWPICCVNTLIELASEQIYSHDAKY